MEEEERRTKQREAEKRWHDANYKKVSFSFSKKDDADILEWLENQPNKASAIKDAIRQAMKK